MTHFSTHAEYTKIFLDIPEEGVSARDMPEADSHLFWEANAREYRNVN
jgi:hypothetical protein